MPEESIGVESTPSVGQDSASATQVAEQSPSSVDYSKSSDFQLLSDEGEGKTEAVAKPPQQPESQPAKTEEPKVDENEPLSPVQISEELKAHFADKKVGKELRDAYYRDAAYREVFPTVAEAREIKNLFPTADDAKAAAESSVAFSDFGNLFYSGSPEFFSKLHEEDPGAFKSLAQTFARVHHKVDPAGYFQDSETRFAQALENMRNEALDSGDENYINAVDVIYKQMFNRFPDERPRRDSRDAEIERLRTRENERLAADETRVNQAFFSSANQAMTEKIQSDVKTQVDRFLADSAVTDQAKVEIAEKVYNEVRRQLSSNPQIKSAVQRAINEGDLSTDHQNRVVALVANRANLIMAQAARTIIPSYTKNVLGIHEQQAAKAAKAASRVDVTGGGAPNNGRRSVLPERGDADFYRKHKDIDILNMED